MSGKRHEEAARRYSRDERVNAMADVLWYFDEEGGLPSGSFMTSLMHTWGKADMLNASRLAQAFPVLADAWGIYAEEGREALIQWAEQQ